MSESYNEQELIEFIAEQTQAQADEIRLVLKHEQAYVNAQQEDAKGEVDVDIDELVDYVLSRSDVKLDELTVESILESEMDYLIKKGVAGYLD
ncbi:hypothetical protein ACFOQM_22680 [Paenibacillus sp. GCM10012307]|uniref:Uncharacterized protein n=1 Tax=Paenibacillus roseus TaxID=2798579 RepID=A0A934J6X7_9BACL|nr:hypothetical protein [Paenibacillus roseus]MBJ6364035.1 hypothetical protein [Paenibacillus roseus]